MTKQERLTRLAAAVSDNIDEMIQQLPPHLGEIKLAAKMLANRLDKEFELVTLSCPVE